MNFQKVAFIGLLCCTLFGARAQDVEKVINDTKSKLKQIKSMPKEMLKQGVKVSGSIASSSVYFDAKLTGNRRIPFESNLSGNLDFNFFGKIKMPFTFNLNTQSVRFTHPFDRQFRYRQPFQLFQFKPTYKGLSLILGSGSMNFSEYTLSGHRFSGVGVEYKPQKLPFYVAFMHGNLLKSIPPQYDSTVAGLLPINQPAFKRKGTALQLGYKTDGQQLELILLQSKDQPDALVPDLSRERIWPEHNAVFSLKGSSSLFKILTVHAEWAVSGITQSLPIELEGPTGFLDRFGGLLKTNYSTAYYQALKAETEVQLGTVNIGLSYNRVDPGYNSHGGYFFVSDLENIALNAATQLAENKISLTASLGRQRNDLNEVQPQAFSQWVGNAGVQYVPSEKFSVGVNYSNFSSITNFRSNLDYLTALVPYNELDTLNYRQIDQNFTGNMQWAIPAADTSINRSLLCDLLYQQSDTRQYRQTDGSKIATLNVGYSSMNKTRKSGFNIGLNLGRNDYLIVQDWLLGPSAGYQKQWEKIKLNANSSLLQTWGGPEADKSRIFNTRLGLDYSPAEKHTLNFTALFMYREVKSILPLNKDFWQYTLGLTYRYNFSL